MIGFDCFIDFERKNDFFVGFFPVQQSLFLLQPLVLKVSMFGLLVKLGSSPKQITLGLPLLHAVLGRTHLAFLFLLPLNAIFLLRLEADSLARRIILLDFLFNQLVLALRQEVLHVEPISLRVTIR